jgi:hypothetical protein
VLHTASLGAGRVAPPPGRGRDHITWESAYSEELVLVVGRRHRLAQAREVRWADLHDEAFIEAAANPAAVALMELVRSQLVRIRRSP